MPRFRMPSLSLKLKLSFLVLVSILALALVGLGGWSGISRMGQALDVLSEHKLPAAIQLGTIRGQLAVLLQASLEVATREQDTTAQPSFKKALDSKRVARKSLEAAVKAFSAQVLSPDESVAWQAFDKALHAWLKVDDQVNETIAELAQNTDEDMQGTLFGKFKIRIFDWSSALEIVNRTQAALVEASLKASQAARAQSVESERSAVKFMLWAFGLAVVFTLVLALRTVLGVTRPLGALRDAIVSIAQQRDFTRRAPMGAQDETGQTVAAFNALLDAVQASLRTVLTEAGQIAESAGAAQDASRRVADASGHQSESAASMAAAMEQMSVSINLIGSGSQDARDRAKSADGTADEGGRIIADTHREMEEIAAAADQSGQTILALRQQSDRISGVLQVIQELADQTNLLALNAAIEAARAGEQGRGFAVVADEVRKLAERTKSSTGEIAATIDGMQQSAREAVRSMELVEQRVASGKHLSAQAADCMSSIRESIAKASEAIADISGAIGEQNQATHAIAAQVETVARMSEDNSLVAQETSRIADALSTRAEVLREAVSQFRV